MNKISRRKSRELATQGLYQWIISNSSKKEINSNLRFFPSYLKADKDLLNFLINGVIDNYTDLIKLIVSFLDRPIEQISLIEKIILLIATLELTYHKKTPYKVIINEAIEITKKFGSTDGYKYVNGVLNKVSKKIRENIT